MDFSPGGTLYLLQNIPFNNSYENTVDFDNASDQYDYFFAKIAHTLDEKSYMRKDRTIKISLNVETLHGVNYCMYRNYSNSKWIYCFISEKNYKNEVTTELVIETDVLQTYMFDYEIKDSFIEREHVDRWEEDELLYTDMKPIYSLTPEDLTLGDEYMRGHETIVKESEKWYLVVTSQPLEAAGTVNRVQDYPTPYCYYIVPNTTPIGSDYIDVDYLCDVMANRPEIISVTFLPYLPMTLQFYTTEKTIKPIPGSATEVTILKIVNNCPFGKVLGTVDKFNNITIPETFATGLTRNPDYESKLLCFPYMFNSLTDYQGEPFIVKNEYLNGQTITLAAAISLSHQPKVRYYVSSGYRDEAVGKDYNLTNPTVNDLPLLTDYYLNYIQTQKASATTGMILAGVQAAAAIGIGIATGGVGLAVGGGVALSTIGKVTGELAKRKDLKATPDSVRYQGNNIMFDIPNGNDKLRFVRFTIAPEIRKILADFFAKYGYKSLEVKTPDLRSRYYYNYIKTVGANVIGNMDQKDLTKIREIYDEGLTIWHDRAGVVPLDYSKENIEMSLL